MIALASKIHQKELNCTVVKMWVFSLGSFFNNRVKELLELLPRYEVNNFFISDKFKKRFPDFRFTSYQEGITEIISNHEDINCSYQRFPI